MSEREELGPAPSLESLVGLRLSIIRRVVDMLILHFGAIRETRTRKGKLAYVGELSVHISGSWRIDGPEKTIVGQEDLHAFAGAEKPDNWTYKKGNTRLDAKLDATFPFDAQGWRPSDAGFTVASVDMSRYGDLSIGFVNNFAIRAFPSYTEYECWRLFEPGGKSDHLVVPDYN
ncbi:hypothetical protein [Mesorhizobium australicum]|uniref:Uncharacterized protein n=1 Tax=Mesorhizobium australicum TaxID=536018 RepID=A0A1X7P3Z4_9HYPH|nr:hypothetical protein [Mesorhizobium australicum]SMH45406.1 hypothetical protein SAMN02982922_3199 [Mesorhizobium australicum]